MNKTLNYWGNTSFVTFSVNINDKEGKKLVLDLITRENFNITDIDVFEDEIRIVTDASIEFFKD